MKKAFLGVAILAVYGVYSLGIRHQQPTIPKPVALGNTNGSSGGGSSGSGRGSNSSSSSSGNQPAANASASAAYKDGTYTGSTADAYYGNVQVAVTISGGKITNVKFLQYPNSHSASVYINQQVMPYLKQEAVQAQSANVQIISGATFTSQAFAQSLQNALRQAQS
jgi:uncharacterized protein with FMN-binding domain